MEECESLDSEMTELQEFQNETMSQDDDDEVEELTNSLREVVQDPTVKPKLQCLLVDPSFSMVTVQSEDSGIVWETASSRCSTPWASETGSISDGCSMEGSGGAGKITIVFDEEKIIRRRTRSGGRSSRLVDRLSRPGSSRSASALGVERLEMAEVSLPNVKQEKSETEPDLEDIKNKDQQLFSLISEGYEILNIRVPSKLPTVDEEESTELQDNLSFLDQTPRIKSRNNQDWTLQQNHDLPDDDELLDHREPSEEDSPQSSADTELRQAPILKDRGCDIDYFEQFTFLDVVAPGEQTLEQQVEAEQPAAMPQVEEQKAAKMATDSPSASEDSFVFVTDVDIVEEHLDEVFYGEGAPADVLKQSKDEEEEEEEGARIRSRRESQRSGKENGSVLFGSEDTILTPIFLSTGPPKIIDQILLDEPTAMSFMYSDLYEDALGERRRSDEEYSEAESVASEKSYKRRFSDSEEADGYLEKFTLKDETPTVEVEPESEPEEEKDGRMVWARNKFEMTGCLKKVSKSEKEAETKTEEPKRQEISVGERSEELQSGASLDKTEIITETEKETEETQPSIVTEKLAVSEDSVQELKLREGQGADQVEKYEQTGPPESSTDEPLPETQQVVSKVEKTEESEEQVGQVPAETEKPKAKLPCQTLEEVEKIAQVVVNATEEKAVIAPVISEVPHTVTNSEIATESTEKSLELATDTTMVSAEDKALAETIAEAAAEVTEPETERQEVLSSIEIETSAEIPLYKGKEVPDDVAQVEVIADCDSAVCAVVEVFEKVVDEKEIQTQVQIDLQEVTSVATTDVQTAAPEGDKEREAITEETAVESQLPDSLPEADQEIEVKTEVSSGVAGTAMLEEVETDSEEKQQEILESKQHPQEESVTHDDLDKTTLVTEAKDKTLTEDTVQEMVHIGDELILRVPKGQAVEMNIEISQGSEKAKYDKPDSTWECLIAPESPTISPGGLQTEKTMTDAQLEVKQEVVLKEEALLTNKLDDRCSLPVPLEEANTESDAVALIGPDSQYECLIAPESTTECPMVLLPNEETMADPQPEVKPDVVLKEEALPTNKLDDRCSPPAPLEQANTESDEVALIEPDSTYECLIAPEGTTECPMDLLPNKKTMADPQLEVKPEIIVKEALPTNELDDRLSPPVPLEEANTESDAVALIGPDSQHECLIAPESTTECPMDLLPNEETMADPQLEVKPEIILKEEALPTNDLDNMCSSPAHLEEASTKSDAVALFEPDSTREGLIAPESTTICLGGLLQKEETMADAQHEVKPEVILKEEALPTNELNDSCSPPALLEEANTERDAVALSIPDNTYECLIAPENTTICPGGPLPHEETMADPQLEVIPEVLLKEEVEPTNELPLEEANTEEQKLEQEFEEDEGISSNLRSFTPQEDLFVLGTEAMQSEAASVEQKVEMHTMDDALETIIVKEDSGLEMDLHSEDVGQRMEQDEAVAQAVEEPEYEVISKQDAKEIEMLERETQRDAEELKVEPGLEGEERLDMEIEVEVEVEKEEGVVDLSEEEELIEADYDIIDAEEQNQARLAAELQGMDWFCLTCGCLLPEDDFVSGEHHSHEVTAVDKAHEEIKEKLGDWISELQGRSENIEDLVSELELAYNSVEDQYVETETAMRVQNEEIVALVMEQYNNMSVSMEEEKKAKLEQLYDQIVSFQESIDSAKATLETTSREAETDARSPEDIHARLKVALDSAMSLELGPKGLLVFEDYAKGNTSRCHLAQRKGIPVPQRPTLQPQEPGSATSSSVTVYWKVNPGDIIDCFQVYCMEDPQGAVSEEYRVTVKESYCVLEELDPNKTYKVWVMAVNYTGCSLPSERLAFRTAPSVPVIDTERCTVMWDSAMLRWSSAEHTTEQSCTLEYCRQYELEGEGLRSISGIKSCEHRVVLQPNENYLFYIKAVNEAGASEQSEAALISTKGTRFRLLKASAHPALELSADENTLHYSQEDAHKQCPCILGELLPARGHHYWETIVSGSTAYRLGVAHSSVNRNSPLGENSLSWCLQCIPTQSGCRYQLLHNGVQSSVFVIETPERVGTLLDYQHGRLSFYNAQSGQLLGTFCQRFTQPCHPALGLEMRGSLEISMVLEVPEFTKDS